MDKTELRKHFISLRDSFKSEYRERCDKIIADFLFETNEYAAAYDIFVYVSVKSEVDTSAIIQKAFADGKKVAVPFCSMGFMNFYYIDSIDELVCSQFGVPTVDANNAVLAKANSNTLCIVPALSFDNAGNRLGYGGGYYDRFLAANNVKAIGLCREKSLSVSLPAEEYDVRIDTVITEKSISRRRGNIGKQQ